VYGFIVRPPRTQAVSAFAIAGARKMRVDAADNLILETEDGEVQFHKPET
jgi:hypothetical protein